MSCLLRRWTNALGHFLTGLRKHVAHRLADERRGGAGGGDDDDAGGDDEDDEDGDGPDAAEPDDDTGAAGAGEYYGVAWMQFGCCNKKFMHFAAGKEMPVSALAVTAATACLQLCAARSYLVLSTADYMEHDGAANGHGALANGAAPPVGPLRRPLSQAALRRVAQVIVQLGGRAQYSKARPAPRWAAQSACARMMAWWECRERSLSWSWHHNSWVLGPSDAKRIPVTKAHHFGQTAAAVLQACHHGS